MTDRERASCMRFLATAGAAFFLLLPGCGGESGDGRPAAEEARPSREAAGEGRAGAKADHLLRPGESTLSALVQLTFEGDNGEAYFNGDASQILFQSTREGHEYDQIYLMNRDGTGKRMVSTGKGRTTCSYFVPGRRAFIYASTHLRKGVPPRPEGAGGYEWAFDDAFDIFLAGMDGKILARLTDSPGYDAECTVSPSGRKTIWTSRRDGDLEIYTMNVDGSDPRRITNAPGYDGGAFFSPDEKQIVYRASRTESYKDLQLYVCDADGTNHHRITENDGVNFAPYFHPDGAHIIFSSNMDEPRNFDLYMVDSDGSNVTRITHSPGFDGFPYFSHDGGTLLFCSNRAAPDGKETHVFLARFTPYWE